MIKERRKMKISKLSFLSAVALTLAIGGTVSPVEAASASSINEVAKSDINKVKTSYNSKAKKLTISGSAAKGNKVVVKYNKMTKTVKVVNGKFKISVKFKGYKPFSLYATDKKGKKVTSVKKLASADYAAKVPVNLKSARDKKGITYTFSTSSKGEIALYYAGKKVMSKKTTSDKTKVVIPAKKLKGKKGYFTVKQFETGKRQVQLQRLKLPK